MASPMLSIEPRQFSRQISSARFSGYLVPAGTADPWGSTPTRAVKLRCRLDLVLLGTGGWIPSSLRQTSWWAAKLGHVIRQRNEIVHPKDNPAGTALFVGLQHIEGATGRRIGEVPIDLATMTGRKARFLPGDIVYGYLRPYLNKVWLADLEGFCSVDQYVLSVDATRADAGFVALYLLSDAYLSRAPITTTPGQLPRIRSGEVLSVPMPLPLLSEQRRIAARVREQLAEIDRARAALETQRAAIEALPAALLREALGADYAASGGGH